MESEIEFAWWYNTTWDKQIGKIKVNYILK
jgi:hypothetical protein